MAACNFSIPAPGDPSALLQKARSAVTGQGGTFEGNEQGGSFHLSVFGSTIAGAYTVAGGQMEVNIHDKPFLLPCGTIESFLRSQLGV